MSQKSRELLTSEANSNIPDNSSAAVTAAKVRQRLIDIIDSTLMKTNDSTATGRELLLAASKAAARVILELGDAATKNVGTTAETVAAGEHTHDPSDIESGGASTGQVLTWNGSAYVPATPSGGLSTVTCTEDSSVHNVTVVKLSNGDYILVPVPV
jgi:hypothetical protein